MPLRLLTGTRMIAILLAVLTSSLRAATPEEHFERTIRPVLADTCFGCHGGSKTSGGLRVDSLESLLAGGDSGPAIVPGNPDESLLLRAIERQSDVSAMPPEKSQSLRPGQVADFVTWINHGAVWPATSAKFRATHHWAFEPLQQVTPPAIHDMSWAQTPLDRFIRDRQEKMGVVPAAPADKLTLLRRATFDLTGLPPTPDEIDAFMADRSTAAFARVVDRLLDSTAYGERWGRHWLDVVRYADTAGETADYPVHSAWRYRNYVIESFQSDKPYDQFLREQMAGDILAQQGPRHQYAEQVTATGFLAISRRFGFDSENYHHLTIQDTIDTIGQALLGLSLGCARCHDHKFDDVSMRDYYALYGIFDSSRYSFPGSEQKQRMRTLAPLIPPHESIAKWREFDAHVAMLSGRLAKQNQPVPTAVLKSLSDIDGDFELQAVAAGGSNGVLVPPWLYDGMIAVTNEAQSPFKHVYSSGKVGASVAANSGAYRIAQALYPQRTADTTDSLYVNIDFRIGAGGDSAAAPHRIALGALHDLTAAEILITPLEVALRIDDRVVTIAAIEPQQWQNLQLRLDLRNRNVNGRVGVPGKVTEFAGLAISPRWLGTIDYLVLDRPASTDGNQPSIEFDNLAVQEAPIAPVSVEASPMSVGIDPAESAPSTEQDQQQLDALLTSGPFAMTYGMSEGTPHNVRMQLRGEPEQPGDEVPRGILALFGGGPLPAGTSGSGRLELANWLTSTKNPLTARVMVNRIWQHHFGQGLVKTPNDFGVRGLPPTHPELLDFLASEFQQSGWSIKAMHRLIMGSATYQQASTLHESNRALDTTDLYCQFARRRLSAEEIRDSILDVTGGLDRVPGTGHPFPSPVTWGFTQHGPYSAVYDHRQRSVYLMAQRLKRHPYLALFDGADPNASTAERRGTTVPTQALFFLNSPFIHSQAELWSSQLLADATDTDQRLDSAMKRAFGRRPSDVERVEAHAFLAIYGQELTSAGADQVEMRTLAAYLRTIFGSNEFLHVD